MPQWGPATLHGRQLRSIASREISGKMMKLIVKNVDFVLKDLDFVTEDVVFLY